MLNYAGFTKGQLRVQISPRRILKINGERQVTGNVIRRFYKEFKIPSEYNTKEVRAKFEGGLLFVRLPKQSTSTTKPPEEASRPQQPPATVAQPPEPIKERVEEKNDADSRKEQSDIAKGKPKAEAYIDEVSHTKEKSTDGLEGKGKTTTSGALEENGTFDGLGEQEKRIDKTQEENIVGLGDRDKEPKNVVNLVMAIVLFLVFGMYIVSAIVSSFGGSKIQKL